MKVGQITFNHVVQGEMKMWGKYPVDVRAAKRTPTQRLRNEPPLDLSSPTFLEPAYGSGLEQAGHRKVREWPL